jgi:hypothetical protein
MGWIGPDRATTTNPDSALAIQAARRRGKSAGIAESIPKINARHLDLGCTVMLE